MQQTILPLIVYTANILGIFSDPFEFAGDYGSDLNPIRDQIFERVVSKTALVKNLSDAEIILLVDRQDITPEQLTYYRRLLVNKAAQEEKTYGPTLSQLVTPDLLRQIQEMQLALENDGFTQADLTNIFDFIDRYKDQKIFFFLRNHPPSLLSLDKPLRDRAAREGTSFNMPILGSTMPIRENDRETIKSDLVNAVFNPENIALAKPQASIQDALSKLDKDYISTYFGKAAKNQDLEAFSSPAGQLFFYWMYHSLNLHLVGSNPQLITQINQVKEVFGRTLGNPMTRAQTMKDKLMVTDAGVLFTQECDGTLLNVLTEDELFLSVDRQNKQDGTLVLLRSDLWEPDYTIVPLEGYAGYDKGAINMILATRKDSGEKYLLASCHGHSTDAADGRRQITLVMEAYHLLLDGTTQLLIGIDANTKTEEDVTLLQVHLEELGLVSTHVGPTTIKKRMVSTQHSKVGRLAIDEEDYLITLKPESGGKIGFSHITVGFEENGADVAKALPNVDNPSDHYPIGATLYHD